MTDASCEGSTQQVDGMKMMDHRVRHYAAATAMAVLFGCNQSSVGTCPQSVTNSYEPSTGCADACPNQSREPLMLPQQIRDDQTIQPVIWELPSLRLQPAPPSEESDRSVQR